MPNVNITAFGYTLSIPGVYYQDNVDATIPTTPPPTPPMIFIGYGYGGKPLVPYTFTNTNDLQNFLRGAPCSNFVQFISNPSPALSGTNYITFINASSNTQSAIVLNNATGVPAMRLTSTNYGPPSNILQAQVSNASYSGASGVGIKLTLTDNFAQTSITGDNLGLPFAVAYIGTATSGLSYSVSSSGMVLTSPNPGETFLIPLGSVSGYSNISQVVNAVNGTGYYLGEIVSSTLGELPANLLDAATNVALTAPSGTVPQFVTVKAYANDPTFWVNQFASLFASGTYLAPASGALLPTNGGPTYFSGATGVPPTTSTYANALNVALSQPGWAVVIDSNLPAVQALGAQHAQTASTPPYGMWRRYFTGSQIGDSISVTEQNTTALDSFTSCYVYPGIYRNDNITGTNVLFDGNHAAFAAASMATGNQIALPLTNKSLNGTGLEVSLTQSQINTLQSFGAMPLYLSGPNRNVPTIVSDLTTWQVDANPSNVFTQQVACRWWLAYSTVNALRPYVGTIASNVTEAQILKAVKLSNNNLIFSGGSSNGVLNSWDASTLTLIYNGSQQAAAIQFDAVLVGQNRFITVYVPIQPLNISITAA